MPGFRRPRLLGGGGVHTVGEGVLLFIPEIATGGEVELQPPPGFGGVIQHSTKKRGC